MKKVILIIMIFSKASVVGSGLVPASSKQCIAYILVRRSAEYQGAISEIMNDIVRHNRDFMLDFEDADQMVQLIESYKSMSSLRDNCCFGLYDKIIKQIRIKHMPLRLASVVQYIQNKYDKADITRQHIDSWIRSEGLGINSAVFLSRLEELVGCEQFVAVAAECEWDALYKFRHM